MVSAVIITKDEQEYIERCIRSLDFADEVIVVDSQSTDRTCEIARGLGAVIVEQEWLGTSVAQRIVGVEAASHDWVFCLDADEMVSAELSESLKTILASDTDPRDGYALDRRDDLVGGLVPNESRRANRLALVRLFNRRFSGWDRAERVHETVKVEGKSIPVEGALIHWRGSDVNELVATLNRFATVESEILDGRGVRATPAAIIVRPLLRFLWCYVWKRGFLFGVRGFIWSFLRAMAEGVRWAKLWERQQFPSGQKHPPAEVVNRRSSGLRRLVR